MKRNILLLMSGSIACAKASGLVSAWVKQGHSVRVAMTASAQAFIGPATLEGLSGQPVFDDAFETGRAMDHIRWAQWADLVVVAPATANLINKLATGLADDAVTTLWQAAWGRNIPLFLVPAMNTQMWRYPATRQHVAQLRQWGVHVMPTAEGDLACGEQGAGRMLEVDDLLSRIDAVLDFRPAVTGRRILVTGGGTREPIDDVRFIGNHSSGRTAGSLAQSLAEAGHEVTWLGASYAPVPEGVRQVLHFETFEDLAIALESTLSAQDFDLVVHAAAVSDYSVAAPSVGGKLSSDQPRTLSLKPNPKLLSRLRDWSRNPDIRIMGFKLTSGADGVATQAAVEHQFQQSAPDWVVHNDMAEIRADRHRFSLYTSAHDSKPFENSETLAKGLERLLV